jgi:acetyltransferase-like isoleucine patch superfamily enzyme/2-polyprenyl-3-methyl-5-hydroxy-6-metoxy-1,4-benzoquinol methylase
MKYQNIFLGSDVDIDPSTTFNNVIIRDKVKIANGCNIYGGPDNLLEIGANSYIGMKTILNGFAAKLTIGENVSISQYVNIMVDSGPNASPGLQKIFPIVKGPINIGNDSWIGAGAVIMPNVTLGEFCIVGANSFVNNSFPAFSLIGGSPARLIRSLSDKEKETIKGKGDASDPEKLSKYEKNYLKLPFEDVLRKYRMENVIKKIHEYPHNRFLEIGCGPFPLLQNINDYERMVLVEPKNEYFRLASLTAAEASNVLVINGLIENLADDLIGEDFDFIVIGGFLHEIDNPDQVLHAVRKICSENTIIYSYVPNALSFHRLLADKMGIIENVYERSAHDKLFNRKAVYNMDEFNGLFINNKFEVIESGSYFIKLFAHDQMNILINHDIIDNSLIEGLSKMTDLMPDLGAELYNLCKIDG